HSPSVASPNPDYRYRITPSLSTTTYVGNESMLNACNTSPDRSMYSCQSICFASTNVRQTSSSSSELIPTNSNPLLANFFFTFFIVGTDSLHGGHHVPQKSSNTTLPRSVALLIRWFSFVTKLKSGANGSRARIGFAINFRASAAVFASNLVAASH